MPSKSDANEALDKFIHHIGVPSEILTDGALELHNRNGERLELSIL